MLRGPSAWLVGGGMLAALVWLSFIADEPVAGLNNDELGALIQMSVLGLVLAFVWRGVWTSQRASETMKQVVAWVAIIAVLVTGYSYRDELQHIAHRATLGLVPGSAVTRLAEDGTARVTIGRGNDGHFSVEAQVEGVPIDFLVDTGASTIAISDRDARRIGLDTDRLTYSLPIATANGIARAAPITLDSVTVGGIERNGLRATVSEPGALSQSLLGMNFLGSLASFEIRGERLTLAD